MPSSSQAKSSGPVLALHGANVPTYGDLVTCIRNLSTACGVAMNDDLRPLFSSKINVTLDAAAALIQRASAKTEAGK